MAKSIFGIATPGTYTEVLQLLDNINGKNILDAPAGSGEFSSYLSKQGAKAWALDLIADSAIHVVADMNADLPFAPCSFDIICCIEGIEHIHDPFHLIGEFYKVLRPDGTLVLSTPNVQNLRSRLKFLLKGTFFWFDSNEIHGVGHISVVPWFILKHILTSCGFKDIKLSYNRTIPPILPSWIIKLWKKYLTPADTEDKELNNQALLCGEILVIRGLKKET